MVLLDMVAREYDPHIGVNDGMELFLVNQNYNPKCELARPPAMIATTLSINSQPIYARHDHLEDCFGTSLISMCINNSAILYFNISNTTTFFS